MFIFSSGAEPTGASFTLTSSSTQTNDLRGNQINSEFIRILNYVFQQIFEGPVDVLWPTAKKILFPNMSRARKTREYFFFKNVLHYYMLKFTRSPHAKSLGV